MLWIEPLLLIAAGILAASSLILAKKPDAKQMIDKIAPYQATLGIILLGWGLYNFIIVVGPGAMVKILTALPLLGITLWGMLVSSILLGIMFGMPMVAKMSAGGAAKGEQMAKKLAPFQVIIGLVAIGSSLLAILYNLGILKPF
jgi:hypothetical protein